MAGDRERDAERGRADMRCQTAEASSAATYSYGRAESRRTGSEKEGRKHGERRKGKRGGEREERGKMERSERLCLAPRERTGVVTRAEPVH